MSCDAERQLAYDTSRKEKLHDMHLLRLFNKAIRNPDEGKITRQAMDELREHGFTKTADAFQSWMDCLKRSQGAPAPRTKPSAPNVPR